MGWCSGTEIFDDVVGKILDSKADDDTKIDLIRALITALENQDWDCQSDSDYYDNPLVCTAFLQLHPEEGFSEKHYAVFVYRINELEKENAELRKKLKFEQSVDTGSIS